MHPPTHTHTHIRQLLTIHLPIDRMCVPCIHPCMHPFSHMHPYTFTRIDAAIPASLFLDGRTAAEKAFPEDFQSNERFPVSGRFCSFHPVPFLLSTPPPLPSVPPLLPSFQQTKTEGIGQIVTTHSKSRSKFERRRGNLQRGFFLSFKTPKWNACFDISASEIVELSPSKIKNVGAQINAEREGEIFPSACCVCAIKTNEKIRSYLHIYEIHAVNLQIPFQFQPLNQSKIKISDLMPI